MVRARTDDLGDVRKIADAGAIMRKTLKYTKRLEFHQFSEDFSAQCRIAVLVSLPVQ